MEGIAAAALELMVHSLAQLEEGILVHFDQVHILGRRYLGVRFIGAQHPAFFGQYVGHGFFQLGKRCIPHRNPGLLVFRSRCRAGKQTGD